MAQSTKVLQVPAKPFVTKNKLQVEFRTISNFVVRGRNVNNYDVAQVGGVKNV